MPSETDIAWPTTSISRGLLADPIDPKYVVLKDEFSGGSTSAAGQGAIGELGWSQLNITTAATSDWIASVADHPGIFRLSTAANDNDGAVLALNYGLSFSEVGRLPPLNALTGWRVRFIGRINSTASISIRWGLAVDTNSIIPADGIWWQYDTDAPDVNFSAVCRAASLETKTASAVAAATGWMVFDIWSDTSGTISFSINGGTAINIAATVPTVALSPFFNCVTRTTAGKTADVDFWAVQMTVAR